MTTGRNEGAMHWSVAQIFSKRAPRILKDVEALKHSVMTPTYKRRWYTDGKESETLRPLFPGYLLFQTTPDGWGGVAATEGVIRVLGASEMAGKVRNEEIARMVVDDYCGTHDVVEGGAPPTPAVSKPRRRKPRPSKRARMRAAVRRASGVGVCVGG